VKETRLKMNIWLTIILVIGLSSSLQIPDVDLDYDYELSSGKNLEGKVSDNENFNYYDYVEGTDEESQLQKPLPEPAEETEPLNGSPKENGLLIETPKNSSTVRQLKETRTTSNQGELFFYYLNTIIIFIYDGLTFII